MWHDAKDVDAARKQYSNWQKKFEERTGKVLEIANNVCYASD